MSAPFPPIESVAAMAWEDESEFLRAVSRGVTKAWIEDTAGEGECGRVQVRIEERKGK